MLGGNKWKQDDDGYGADRDIETPFIKARQEWDARTGKVVDASRGFRNISLGLLIALLFSVTGNVIQATKEKVEVHVVEVNPKSGVVGYDGPVINANGYQTNKAVIVAQLSDIVTWTRSIPKDMTVLRDNWERAYKHFTADIIKRVNTEMAKGDYQKKFGTMTTQVEIHSVIPRGKNAYQIRWEERSYTMDGKPLLPIKQYTGIYYYVWHTPDKDQLSANPLGFFIEDFQFKEDLS